MRKDLLVWLAAILMLLVAARRGHAQSPTITVLHAFNGTDGSLPWAPLVQASDGNFYGSPA